MIIDQPTRGIWNMAVDESILESVGSHESPPTLRLYAWEPICLSLGYAQSIHDVDLQRLHSSGWDLVRRPTGGKAILHTDELTYSIIGTYAETLLRGSLLESYRNISQALLAALYLLGIDATVKQKMTAESSISTQDQEAICFEVPSNYEITVKGKKLIGSAQARRKTSILQHGTIPLYGELTRITQVLAYDDEIARDAAASRLRKRATTIEEVLNIRVTWENVAQAFVSSFTDVFGIKLLQSELTAQEIYRAEELDNEKYSDQQWTYKSPILEE